MKKSPAEHKPGEEGGERFSFGLFQPEQRSLFGEILDWMLTPLLLLWPLSLALTWLVAQGIANKPFDRALEFVATGGYALKTYDRFAKIRQTKDGLWRVANPRVAQGWRMNVGTIIEENMLKVRLTRERRALAAPQPSRPSGGGLWYPTKLAGGDPAATSHRIASHPTAPHR